MDLNDVLHENALELLQALRRQNFRLIVFDECHHLTDYWASVMTHLVKRLYDPLIIGLTGTPPEGKSANRQARYLSLVGDIDYQVPTPALVKEGGLAPFQDLVFFTEPTDTEMAFLESQHDEFHVLIDDLTQSVSPDQSPALSSWIGQRVADSQDWPAFVSKQPELAQAAVRYMWKQRLPLPENFELSESLMQSPFIDDWMLLLEDYALHKLKVSASREDHELYERIRTAVRRLGYALTERGIRRQASPVDRVLAYSTGKPQAVAKILDLEYQTLQDRLRAVVVTDFERASQTTTKILRGVLDPEAGGATAAFRELLAHDVSQWINPCLVTGSLLLVDKRIASQFLEASRYYIRGQGYSFELIARQEPENCFVEITAGVSQWETRLYVGMATHLFERGITKCLIGTRGIFGEGWDSQSLNTLIDLTTATSAVSVKQLRGRSIRLNANDPLGTRKVANNWDIVSIAPALEKGLNDYYRFVRKHEGYFGISDDGQIECGVGHVHPAFSELTASEVFASLNEFNEEMTGRALARDQIYNLWKVGQPYYNRCLGAVEVSRLRKLNLTPPHIRRDLNYKTHARQLRANLYGIWWEYGGVGAAVSAMLAYVLYGWGISLYAALLPLVALVVLGRRKHKLLYGRLKNETCKPNTQESSLVDIGTAILSSLQEIRLLPPSISRESIKVTLRSDGSYRVFLDDVEPEHSQYFARCLNEALAPITNQPYLIPKYEYATVGRNENSQEKAFFKAYLAGKAEPRLASYHGVPKLLARSEKGRESFQSAWNKYVSPGFIVATTTKPELLEKYFGMGPSLAQRLLWE
ncbi:MAG: DEAD/DEAH box helicase family protein [Candidatus Melainabacteria bacterium]|nr:DEAD/DEAH box helicase family protein [Candidatus Melainabacteria bacterium]